MPTEHVRGEPPGAPRPDRDGGWYEALVNKYRARVQAMLMRELSYRDPQTAEDLTQETFVTAWLRRDTMPAAEYEMAWLFRTARFHFYNHSRKRLAAPAEPGRHDSVPGADAQAVARLDILRGLRRLSRRQRVILALHYIDGFTYEEIAASYGIKPMAAKKRVQRAAVQLRDAIGSDYWKG